MPGIVMTRGQEEEAGEGVTPVKDVLCENKRTKDMYSPNYVEGVEFEDTDYSGEAGG